MFLCSILVPILWGLALLLLPELKNRKVLVALTGLGLVAAAACGLLTVFARPEALQLFSFGKNLSVFFRVDDLGCLFAVVVSLVWLLSGIYAFEYMKHEREEKRYFGFYVMVYGVLHGLVFAGNMVTFYLFYELMTLLSMPLILHNRSREAVMGGLKYLFYSLFGAYMVLFGLFFLNRYALTLEFLPGGVLDPAAVAGHETLLLWVAFSMIVGFGVKAGMFPLHGWLPTAHPVAPAPASAVMSGIVVKMGVLGMIRVVYYLVGADFLRGSWVQTVWLILSLVTVFMGSMRAYREKGLKKRLAYSTVSQVSYVIFGLMLLNPMALQGALYQAIFHAIAKNALFMAAGAIIYKTHLTQVSQMRGIGVAYPITLWCFALASLSLVGIPPSGGFVSKWMLAQGAMDMLRYPGITILMLSALLTAGYLLPLVTNGFFPGKDFSRQQPYTTFKQKDTWLMWISMSVLAVAVIVLGMFPGLLEPAVQAIIGPLF